jgi:hypothetical protein
MFACQAGKAVSGFSLARAIIERSGAIGNAIGRLMKG